MGSAEGNVHCTHERAVEVHATKRLRERYAVPYRDASRMMFEHLALALAGEGEVRAEWHGDGRQLIRLVTDREYWILFDPNLNRIVTYLTADRRLRRLLGRYGKHRNLCREIGEDE